MDDNKVRLNKYIAQCGICSRREADALIQEGKIIVNNQIPQCGIKVGKEDIVCYQNKQIVPIDEKIVMAFYKPIGATCSEKDNYAKVLVKDMIDSPYRVTYAGRLDKNSEGLLLLTNDGQLIQLMMKGANGHEKEYIVKIDKRITKEFLIQMRQGIYLEELEKWTRKCKVKQIDEFTFSIILTQGLNRQIRRMCNSLGCKVISLKRIRVLNITLDGLTNGQYRILTQEEVNSLYDMCEKGME